MTIQFELNENDYLTFQLFAASKSERIIKKRKRNKVLVPITYIVIGILLFFIDGYLPTVLFALIGIVWFVFYPTWDKRRYRNHYKAFIQENYKDRIGRSVTLDIKDDFILAKEQTSESKLLTSEVEEIIEISTLIFIRIKGGQAYIVPKDRISNANEFVVRLKELVSHLNIKYSSEIQWEWK